MTFYSILKSFYKKAAYGMCKDCQPFIKEGSKILDLGCGPAVISKGFQEYFKSEVFGVDVQDTRVEKIPFQTIDGFNLPFENDSFDICLISYVLHHTKDPKKLLEEAKRVAKEKIIIFEDLSEGFLSKLRCSFHEFFYNMFFQKDRQKFNFKTKKGWEELFRNIGLKVVFSKKISATIFDFLDPAYKILFVLDRGV